MNLPADQARRAGRVWSIGSRVLAASVGAYLLTSLTMAALALSLPHISSASRADGVLIASLLGFALHAAIAIRVFTVRKAGRAWMELVIGAIVPASVIISLQGFR